MDLLAVDPAREPVQHARPLSQRADDAVADGNVVAREIKLRLAALGEVHPVGIGDPHRLSVEHQLNCRGVLSAAATIRRPAYPRRFIATGPSGSPPLGQLEVLLERPMRLDPEPLELAVVGVAGRRRVEFAVGDPPQVRHERERVLAVLDLAPEQRRARAVAPRVLEQEERVVGRARGRRRGCPGSSAGHRRRARASPRARSRASSRTAAGRRSGTPASAAGDEVGQEPAGILGRVLARGAGANSSRKWRSPSCSDSDAELAVGLKRRDVDLGVVGGCDRVQRDVDTRGAP